MPRVRMVVAYDGTGFCGFQRQPNARTVAGVLEARLDALCGHPVKITGSGRTDTGVHALGQVVHFDNQGKIPAGRLEEPLNRALLPEIRVRNVEQCEDDFHARYSAMSRTYRYTMCLDEPSPFVGRYLAYEPLLQPDAPERCQAALDGLLGTHDFAAYGFGLDPDKSTVRTLLRARAWDAGPLLHVELTANGFLRSMMRLIVGRLVEVGQGLREPESLAAILRGEEPQMHPAGPEGLTLLYVSYADGYAGEQIATERVFPWDQN